MRHKLNKQHKRQKWDKLENYIIGTDLQYKEMAKPRKFNYLNKHTCDNNSRTATHNRDFTGRHR